MKREYFADVEAILARRRDNGGDYWTSADGRLAVGAPFSTLTSLLILYELHVPRTHEAVKGELRLVLRAWREDGRLGLAPGGSLYPCHFGCGARRWSRLCLSPAAVSGSTRPTALRASTSPIPKT